MTALFLAPHNDDETLFGAYTLLEHRPHVIVCLRSAVQWQTCKITSTTRELESAAACRLLGCTFEQWGYRDDVADHGLEPLLGDRIYAIDAAGDYDTVFAPAVEEGGHEHHNLVGRIAEEIFADRLIAYMTYRRGHGKSEGFEVFPRPDWIGFKLRALACYPSQLEPATGCQSWFTGDLREWRAR